MEMQIDSGDQDACLFTQMVWEQNIAVIVMLTSFTDMGLVRS